MRALRGHPTVNRRAPRTPLLILSKNRKLNTLLRRNGGNPKVKFLPKNPELGERDIYTHTYTYIYIYTFIGCAWF